MFVIGLACTPHVRTLLPTVLDISDFFRAPIDRPTDRPAAAAFEMRVWSFVVGGGNSNTYVSTARPSKERKEVRPSSRLAVCLGKRIGRKRIRQQLLGGQALNLFE